MTADDWQDVGRLRLHHRDGYDFFSVDRFTLGYEDDRGVAHIGVERSAVYELFPGDLSWTLGDGTTRPMTDVERATVLERIQSGLKALSQESRNVHDLPGLSGQALIDHVFLDRPPGPISRALARIRHRGKTQGWRSEET